MRTWIFVAAIAAVATIAAPAQASEQSDIMNVINAYNESGNSPKLCTPEASILDEFGQHVWLGPTACADWLNAFKAFMKANNIAEPNAKLGTPEHIIMNGDRAYAVFPATYSYEQKGKPVSEHGTWTFALQKTLSGWRISAWTWSLH